MYRVTRELCRYLGIANLAITTFLLLAGPEGVAWVTGAACLSFWAATKFFDRVIADTRYRAELMDRTGSNNIETWDDEV